MLLGFIDDIDGWRRDRWEGGVETRTLTVIAESSSSGWSGTDDMVRMKKWKRRRMIDDENEGESTLI